MLIPNTSAKQVQKLQEHVKLLDQELKITNVGLCIVTALTITNLTLCFTSLFRYPNQQIRVATLAATALCGISSITNIRYKNVVKSDWT